MMLIQIVIMIFNRNLVGSSAPSVQGGSATDS